ncbi:MAG: acetate--CoA ligase family protein [Bacteroidetes bacterium]|nr:acetate--CoA ligase family protein [Bacteroidota bacterium]
MIHPHLSDPRSIAVVGASENNTKPGGKVITNLIAGGFKGEVYAVNKNKVNIPGAAYYADIASMPAADLAILSVPAHDSVHCVQQLCEKGTRAFIMYSAGFGEAGEEGKELENALKQLLEKYDATLIGPNCIGIINQHYKGVFTSPIPEYDPMGCELISSSGATAVFIMEAAMSTGLRFSNIYSIGNALQTGIEDILEHLDTHFTADSPKVKLLYLEDIRNPFKFLRHASSLIRKGCHIAAIKAGYSQAGSRAASSHTGAMASADHVVRALFAKAGIMYCSGRDELITAGCIFQSKTLTGENLAIITHAGGSAVMLTDALESGGLKVPHLPAEDTAGLLASLHPGSSVANPIDFLATGTATQLEQIIDFCEAHPGIDAMIVVFGSPGLFNNVHDVYHVIHDKMDTCTKPIYPVLPSLINAREEIDAFLDQGHVNFPDEVVLGKALPHVYFRPRPTFGMTHLEPMQTATIRNMMAQAGNGYLDPVETNQLLQAAGIRVAPLSLCYNREQLSLALANVAFPLVLKVYGPVHKSDTGGVSLNLLNADAVYTEYDRMMQIPGAKGVVIQPMLQGEELYCGAVKQGQFGHLVICGLGGIFLELLNDVAYGLAPLDLPESSAMIRSLKGYKIFTGYRNKAGVNEALFADAIAKVASLVHLAPEIAEMDINPFKGSPNELIAIDARIRIEK